MRYTISGFGDIRTKLEDVQSGKPTYVILLSLKTRYILRDFLFIHGLYFCGYLAKLAHESSDVLRRATLRPQNLGTCVEQYMEIFEHQPTFNPGDMEIGLCLVSVYDPRGGGGESPCLGDEGGPATFVFERQEYLGGIAYHDLPKDYEVNGTNRRAFFCEEKKKLATRYVNVKLALNWLLRDFKKDDKPIREEVFECLVNPPEDKNTIGHELIITD